MMKIATNTLIGMAMNACIATAAIGCSKPTDRPTLPDPATVVTAQMVKINGDVKDYTKSMETYWSCANLPNSEYEKQLADLKSYVADFNGRIKEFRARHGGE